MLAEYKTFSNKIFSEIKEDVNRRFKNERDNLINMREEMAKELESSLSRIEQLEKQNKALVTKSGERESFIRAEVGKKIEKLKEQINNLKGIIEEKDQYISLIIENPNAKMKFKKPKYEEKKEKVNDKNIVEEEFSFDDNSKKFFSNFDGPVGEFDEKGNYRYSNGSYYDPDGNFHDENGDVFDPQGNLINQKQAGLLTTHTLKKDEEDDGGVQTEIKENLEDSEKAPVKEFADFDVDNEEEEKEKSLSSNEILDLWDEEDETDNNNLDGSTKRKRGRPKKEKPEEPKEKRGRGRPRKEKPEEPKEKRGRGRPRKENVEPPKPKGKRGRPRKDDNVKSATKINIDDLKEIENKIKKQNDILKSQQKDLKNTIKKTTKKATKKASKKTTKK